MADNPGSCRGCGAEFPSGTTPDGLCPKCLEGPGLAQPSPATLPSADLPTEASVPLAPFSGTHLRYFGDYELLEQIAHGGMGIVFRARHIKLNRLVALKLISAGALATPDLVKRFKAEAEATASLSHPNIVPIHEIGEHQDQHYFSMGLIEGPNLREVLGGAPSSPIPPTTTQAQAVQRPLVPNAGEARVHWAVQLLATIARAVHYAHQRGVLHRDLKPSNILLDAQGTAHLTDFGLAKLIEKESTLTHTHAVLGTPAYMSPEQARGNTKDVTTAADVYGLGAVLYETLTGSPPFGGGTSIETIRQVLDYEPRRPSIFNSSVDADLETICLKCLEKDPERRFGSAEALADDLERWLRSEPIQARPAAALERVGKWVRRRPAIAGLTFGLILALLLGGLGVTVQWRNALRHRTVALRNAEHLRQSLYASDTGMAWQAWLQGDARRARDLLEGYLPGATEIKDSRGFEWYYLWNLSQQAELLIVTNTFAASNYSPEELSSLVGTDGMVKLWDTFDKRLVSAVRFSPDGQVLAVAGGDGSIKFLDPRTGTIIRFFKAHIHYCASVAFSSDGKTLVTTSRMDRECKLWDFESGTLLATLPQDMQEVFKGVFSPDGKRLATVAATVYSKVPAAVRIWNVENLHSPTKLLDLQGINSWVGHAEFSKDGRFLVTADGEGLVQVWNSVTGKETHRLTGHNGFVWPTKFVPTNGTVLATADRHGTIILWDWAAGKILRTLTGHPDSPIYDLAVSHDGKRLASASRDHTAKLWDVNTGQQLAVFRGHFGRLWSIDFSPDGLTIVTGSGDGTLRFWRTLEKRESEQLPNDSKEGCGVGFSPDGRFLFRDEFEASRVTLFDASSKAVIQTLPGKHAAFSSDGRRLALIDGTEAVVFDAKSLGEITRIQGESALGGWTALSSDGKLLALRRAGRPVVIDIDAKRETAQFDDHLEGPGPLIFNQSGQVLITGGLLDGSVRLWDVRRGTKIKELRGHQAFVSALALSPDGQIIASGSFDATVRLWNASTGEPVTDRPLTGSGGAVTALAFSLDGKTLAVGTFDGLITLWSIPSWQEVGSLKGHLSNAIDLAFSPDGQTLVSSSYDSTIRLWHAPRSEKMK